MPNVLNMYLYQNLLRQLEYAEMDSNFFQIANLLNRVFQSDGKVFLNTGPVGVGTTTPAALLDVNGGIRGIQLILTDAPSTPAVFSISVDSSGNTVFNNNYSGYMAFKIAGAEKYRIDSAGNLQVGVGSGSTNIFQVDKSGDAALKAVNINAGGIGVVSVIESAASFAWYSTSGGVHKSSILPSGTYQSATSVYGGISDLKLKINITAARLYLDDLCAVRVRKYNFKSDPDGPKQLGVIAQELEAVFPGMVEETPNLAERQIVVDGVPQFEQRAVSSNILGPDSQPVIYYEDDPDKPIMEMYDTGETTKSVKYSVFVPMLITAVQELKAKNAALETRLAALEAKLTV